MTRARLAALLPWAALVSVAVIVVARAHYTTDLSAFLPRTPTATQRLLVDQLREGIASRLILIGIEGGDANSRADVSLDLGRRLRATGLFVSVNNGEPVGIDRDRALLFEHRYLLSESVTPARFTAAGLRNAIQDTLDLLASPVGLLTKELLPRDPTGEMLGILEQVGSEQQPRLIEGAWASRDGQRAVLVAQTRAAGSDTDGQQLAVETIRRLFQASPQRRAALRLEMSGPGVFSVAARANIKGQVALLSIMSTVWIMVMLFLVYRSGLALVLGFIPVASGALAGVAAVALGFGVVHGITLGFGVTLIGESVDYSIYLFIQSRSPRSQRADWKRSLWPTIRLGVLTSVVGFASLLPSAFPGLAQLGLYSITGLVAAALVTRFVLPDLLPADWAIRDISPLGAIMAGVLRRFRLPRAALWAIPVLAVCLLYVRRDSIWNNELGALSPVSESDQALDGKLRGDLGAPDPRYLVVVTTGGQESALRAAESVGRQLQTLTETGVIEGFESPARYLPSVEAQQTRQASIPEGPVLRNRLSIALDGLPLRAERLEPFIKDAEAARTQALLTRSDLEGTSLATGVNTLLLNDPAGDDRHPAFHGGTWTALLPLRVPASFASNLARVHAAVSQAAPGQAVVLDIKAQADLLYTTYLSEVVKLSLAGFGGIVVLLFFALRSPARVVRVVAPLVLAVLTVTAGFVLARHELTILHLIGMLLIVAVGSNYALFFDRRTHDPGAADIPLTLASLLVANACTVLAFGTLAFSTVPVLSALGSTVAPGTLLALLYSALLTRELPVAGQPAVA